MTILPHEEFPSMLQRQRDAYTRLVGDRDLPMVLFGAGDMGRRVLSALRAAGKDATCFCDNKRTGMVADVPVLPVSTAASMLRMDGVFVVCVFNASECYQQLRLLGCENAVSAATLCRHLGSRILSLDSAAVVDDQRDDVLRCGDLWADEQSRSLYQQLVDWFCGDGSEPMLEHDDPKDTYWPEWLWKPMAVEHVVDCGAYDGDSVQSFADKLGVDLASLTAYEPDPENYRRLRDRVASMPEPVRDRVATVEAALGEESGTLRFAADGTVSSGVAAAGGSVVPCVDLDGESLSPTYVKMDLEGYELEALRGAARTLREQQPVLAVTCYHLAEHLWRVPLLIHSLNPSYKLYLRKYAEDCWESICYAVPRGRVPL